MPKFDINIATQDFEPFVVTWNKKDYTVQIPTMEFMEKFDAVCQETIEALKSKEGEPDYEKINVLTRKQLTMVTGIPEKEVKTMDQRVASKLLEQIKSWYMGIEKKKEDSDASTSSVESSEVIQ